MIKNYLSPKDLLKTDKETLVQIANELSITESGTNIELVANIWEELNDNNFEEVMSKHKEKLFSHRGSYVTYKLKEGNINGFSKRHIENFLNRKLNIKDEEINSEPQILSAYELNNTEILVRVTFRDRFETQIYNESVQQKPIIEQIHFLIDKENELVEVRANYETSRKIIEFLLSLDEKLKFEQPNINKKDLKHNLDATLLSSVGYTKNEQVVLSDKGKDAVENIIAIIDNCLTSDIEKYDLDELKQQIDILREEEEVNNFVLLLISGLGKLDLSSLFNSNNKEDLSRNSLYQIVEPYIEANSMFLSVPFDNNGIMEELTIKVGLNRNVITFISTPTEAFIRQIRKQII